MSVDKKISQLASGAPAQAGDEYVVARSGANYKLTLTNIAGNMPATTISSGNLTFSSTGQRITFDMSGAMSNRLMFQTSTTNSASRVGVIPNGTSAISEFGCYNNSSPDNASLLAIKARGSDVQIDSTTSGTGTAQPLTFAISGGERMRLDTSGNVGIGTTSPATGYKLSVSAATASNTVTGGINIQSNRSYSTSNNGVIFSAIANNGTIGSHDFGALVFKEAPNSNGGSAYVQMFAGGASTTQGAANKFLEGYFDGSLMNYVAAYTNGSERMRIDSSGNVGIGGTAAASVKLSLSGTAPSSSGLTFGYYQNMTLPSSTTSAYLNYTVPAVASGATVTTLGHFYAAQGTFTGSATNQYGFVAESSLTGATNNYGFFSNIASGSNRWNFYAAGTAQNYFAGNTGFGTTSLTYNVEVAANTNTFNGLRITNTNAGSSAASALYFGTDIDATIGYIAVKSGAGTDANQLIVANRVNHGILFRTNDTNRAFLSAAGEFITGGTTDQGAYNLQCNGTGVWGAGAYVNGSDARLKDNIQSLDSGLDVVKAMRPVTFQYKPEYSKDQSVQPGFIAQELQTAMAGKPYLEGVVQEGTNHLNVAYQNIIPILVKAIQELEAKVAALEAK